MRLQSQTARRRGSILPLVTLCLFALIAMPALAADLGQITVKVGKYAYMYNDSNPSQEGFQILWGNTDATEPYSAVRTTINFQGNLAFARLFGMNTFNTTANATAVHRPRDVMIIMDLS